MSTADLLTGLTGQVWAYCCTSCAQTFLRPGKRLVAWRSTAVSLVDDGLYAAISTLAEVPCKSMAGVDPLRMPLGMCDRCYCRTKRARRRDGGIEPCVSGNALPSPKHRSPVACEAPRMGGQAGCHASHTPQSAMAGPPRVVGMAPRQPTVCLPSVL